LFHSSAIPATPSLSLHDALPISPASRRPALLRVAPRPSAFRAEVGKQDHLTDGRLVGEEHRQPVDADPLPRRRRHAELERADIRSEEHTSELQSLAYLVCRLLLE